MRTETIAELLIYGYLALLAGWAVMKLAMGG